MHLHRRLAPLVLALLVLGCGEPSDELKNVGVKMGETWDAMKTYAVTKKGEAVEYFSENMESMDENMEAWKRKAAEMGGDASRSLDAGWADVQEKFEAMKGASGEAWERSRDAFVAAYETFAEKVDGADKVDGE